MEGWKHSPPPLSASLTQLPYLLSSSLFLHAVKWKPNQAKLSLIPARGPPGPQCEIKHLMAAPVPLSRQKDTWRLKLGEDDGSFLRCFNNSWLNICIFLLLCVSLFFTLSYSLSYPATLSLLFSVFSLFIHPPLQSQSSPCTVSLWRSIFKDLFLLMLCRMWVLCKGGRFKVWVSLWEGAGCSDQDCGRIFGVLWQ